MPTITKLIPRNPLDSPLLAHGPYTDQAFQEGMICAEDRGLLYGYSYRPQRFTGDEKGIMGTSTLHPVRYRDGVAMFGDKFPWFDSAAEAVAFLKFHGYYGQVMRYQNDPKCLRGETEKVTLLAGVAPFELLCEPWITAGVSDVVNAISENSWHGHLIGHAKMGGPIVHVRDETFEPAVVDLRPSPGRDE